MFLTYQPSFAVLHCTAREVPDLQEAIRKWQLNLTCKRFWETSPVSCFEHLLSENKAEHRKLFLIPPASPPLRVVKSWLLVGTLPVPRLRTGGHCCTWTGWSVCPAALCCEREVLCPQKAGSNPPASTTPRKERASHLPVKAALLQPFYLLSSAIAWLVLPLQQRYPHPDMDPARAKSSSSRRWRRSTCWHSTPSWAGVLRNTLQRGFIQHMQSQLVRNPQCPWTGIGKIQVRDLGIPRARIFQQQRPQCQLHRLRVKDFPEVRARLYRQCSFIHPNSIIKWV